MTSEEIKKDPEMEKDEKKENDLPEEDQMNEENAGAGAEAAGPEEEPNGTEAPGDDRDGTEEAEESDKKADAEEESWNEKYVRLMADFQNYKRRTEKDKADVYAYANEKIMTDLLQVLDNFERALSQECSDESYAEGMNLIFKQMHEVLVKSGLEEIEALGKEFDPNFHHAVMTDDNDEFKSGCVTTVLQKGYKLNDKVIRPAMVSVNN